MSYTAYDFTEVMLQHSDKKLGEILTTEKDQYQPAAIESTLREFDKRNLNIHDFITPEPELELEPEQSNAAAAYNINAVNSPEQNNTATYEETRKAQAEKDMLYGALWCIGGIVATAADIGFIFWGAIVYGGIQFFKGLSSRG